MQHFSEQEKPRKRGVDGLSVGFLAMAALAMAVSIPATFSVAAMTHASWFGAVLVVIIAEVLSFGAKMATRWFSSWAKQLNAFAITMLTAAVLPNAAEGYNALFRPDAAEGVWLAIRDTLFFGVPVFAILITAIWAALPPVGVYLALTFWVRRQYELETEHTPEAVVNRRLQPIIIEMQVQQRLDQALLGLVEERQKQYAALTGPVFTAPRLADFPAEAPVEPYRFDKPLKAPANARAEEAMADLGLTAQTSEPVAAASEVAADGLLDLGRYIYGDGPAPKVAPEVLGGEEPAPARPTHPLGVQLDGMLASAGLTRAGAKTRLEQFRIQDAGGAFTALRRFGKLPDDVTREAFAQLYEVLYERACDSCGEPLSQGQRGVAVKFARKHNQPVRCTACRQGK